MSSLAQSATKIAHSQGEIVFSAPPEKVISFDLISLDTLDALGVDVQGAPKQWAKAVDPKYATDSYINIGSLHEPDFEAIAAAQPDLVLLGPRTAKSYPMMSSLAPTIDMTLDPNHLWDSFKARSQALANLFNKQALLEIKLTQLDTKIAEAQRLAASSGNGLFIMTNGGKITAFGLGSRFGWLHEELGIEPTIKDVKAATHGDPISFEFILNTNPDWLFVLDRDAAIGKNSGAAQALLDNELIQQTKASKNKQIVYLNGTNWYVIGAGLSAMNANVDEILNALRTQTQSITQL
ncbi:siderophore ABC transporter substrate-binding protein [Corallincola luteus]|uniref:Siderophore ABC transporter substrate-binding protein n=1 Tax=Corallincola luteus TaxID=1775177 RepID=A0ABY2AM37_9GAMM|nr:siderophore ABC transporter substrate-binding protein [Corallincola luteus]TCI03791.1 siderophore ABC transporter substrate-binding protein [Corallincola luteus]